MDHLEQFIRLIYFAFIGLVLFFLLALLGPPKWPFDRTTKSDLSVTKSRQTHAISAEYVLAPDPNLIFVQKHCSGCHSNRLIAQNRNTRDGWKENIRWMQKTQGLWDLGDDEAIILDYLSTYYAPENIGRRKNIDVAASEWYFLE